MADPKDTQSQPSKNLVCTGSRRVKRRTRWTDLGCSICAYPSDGSFIIKPHGGVVDMAFLGMERLSPPIEIFQDKREEDKFAKLLLKAGGTRWSSLAHFKYSRIVATAATFEERIVRVYGWPGISTHPDSPYQNSDGSKATREEAGVWVIEDTWQARFDTDDESYQEDSAVVLGKLQMALDMEEKIEVMKELGAKFYSDPRDFPGLKCAYDPNWPDPGSQDK